jgi:starch phosphorylase
MKGVLNGVPSLRVRDGWWLEGHQEGVTGWAIGDGEESATDPSQEVAALYGKLEHVIPHFGVEG